MASRRAINPFYVLLTLTGVAFVITACLYGVMTVRMLDPVAAEAAIAEPNARENALMAAVDKHGVTALAIEVAILGVATVLAITTDDFWTRNSGKERSESLNTEPTPARRDVNAATATAAGGRVGKVEGTNVADGSVLNEGIDET